MSFAESLLEGWRVPACWKVEQGAIYRSFGFVYNRLVDHRTIIIRAHHSIQNATVTAHCAVLALPRASQQRYSCSDKSLTTHQLAPARTVYQGYQVVSPRWDVRS